MSETVPDCSTCGRPSPWGDPCQPCADAPLFDLAAYALSIRRRMADLNISYRDAAPTIGISHATLHRTAKAKGLPDVETYLRINRWLELP